VPTRIRDDDDRRRAERARSLLLEAAPCPLAEAGEERGTHLCALYSSSRWMASSLETLTVPDEAAAVVVDDSAAGARPRATKALLMVCMLGWWSECRL